MNLTRDDIARVCRLVDEVAGIQWDASKTYLIESRLAKLLVDHGCADVSEMVARIRSGAEPELRVDFIDAITTRETLFFRDESPFLALKHKALPEIIDTKQGTPFSRRLRVWSAACSSGQEPYSLGIVLREMIDDIDEWDVQILATDLSTAALATASRGVYSEFDLSRGVSPEVRKRYFTQVKDGWRICDEVRSLVSFQPCNLLEPFRNKGPFDAIFCRNVAIYFDAPVRKDLFERLAATLSPVGALFVGGSENLSSMGSRWVPQHHCRGVFYLPNRVSGASTTAPIKPAAPPIVRAGAKPSGTPVLAMSERGTAPVATNGRSVGTSPAATMKTVTPGTTTAPRIAAAPSPASANTLGKPPQASTLRSSSERPTVGPPRVPAASGSTNASRPIGTSVATSVAARPVAPPASAKRPTPTVSKPTAANAAANAGTKTLGADRKACVAGVAR